MNEKIMLRKTDSFVKMNHQNDNGIKKDFKPGVNLHNVDIKIK